MLLNPILIICILMISLAIALMNGNGVKDTISIFLFSCPALYLFFWCIRFIGKGY